VRYTASQTEIECQERTLEQCRDAHDNLNSISEAGVEQATQCLSELDAQLVCRLAQKLGKRDDSNEAVQRNAQPTCVSDCLVSPQNVPDRKQSLPKAEAQRNVPLEFVGKDG
jgi:hypothetical protein